MRFFCKKNITDFVHDICCPYISIFPEEANMLELGKGISKNFFHYHVLKLMSYHIN
jgi:hypothetical protein